MFRAGFPSASFSPFAPGIPESIARGWSYREDRQPAGEGARVGRGGGKDFRNEASFALVPGRPSPQPEIESQSPHEGQDGQDFKQDINPVDDLRQPENTGPEIVSQENQQRDEDQSAQEIVQKEFPELDPHGPGGKKGGDPEPGDKARYKYGFVPMVPVELPASLQTLLR